MTSDEIIAVQMQENTRIRQERLEAKPLTSEEKIARQTLLMPQINAQHNACMKLPVNVAKVEAIRSAGDG